MPIPTIVAAIALFALVTAIILVTIDPTFAVERVPSPSGPGPTRGAPGPIAGAGLLTVMVGAGALYWLCSRFRKPR